MFITFARGRTGCIYHNRGDNGDNKNGGRGGARKEKAKSVRHQADSHDPDFASVILALWMQNAKKGRRQAQAMKADRTREKVQTWLDSAE